MIAYALFWGIGLPFICLGAIAEPGHPHTAPHFVFAEPANERLADVAAHALQLATANDATARFYELYLSLSSQILDRCNKWLSQSKMHNLLEAPLPASCSLMF